MRLFLALCLAGLPAGADTLSLSGSTVTLQPTSRPGAMAEVVFDNRNVNSSLDEGDYQLDLDDLALPFSFDWNASMDDDAITVEPPEGLTCLPTTCVLRLPEGEVGTLWLYSTTGVGM